MRWIEHDAVERSGLPAWARDAGERLPAGGGRALGEGLVLRVEQKSQWIAVPWEQVLAVARTSAQAFVLAPRRPPSPPWIAVGLADADRIEQIQRARREQGGFRAAAIAPRERQVPSEVLRRVLARDDIPGAVEVPLGVTPPSKRSAGVVAGVTGGYTGLMVCGELAKELHQVGLVLGITGVVGLAAGASVGGLAYYTQWRSAMRRKRERVLVMTPDAYIGGLDGGPIRAIAWEEIEAFRQGELRGVPALEVIDDDGRVLARVDARFFGIDLSVLVALATAYRAHALGG